jgi:hypothetical protein
VINRLREGGTKMAVLLVACLPLSMLEQAVPVARQQGLEIEARILEDAIKKRTFTKKTNPAHTHIA